VLIVLPQDTVLAGTYEHHAFGACTYWLKLFKAVTGQISSLHKDGYWTGHDLSTDHDRARLTGDKI